LKRLVLTLFIVLSLALVMGPGVLADDPPDSDSASVSLKVEIVPSTPPAPSGGISMFRLYGLTIENITEDSADIIWETSRSTTSKLTYWSSPEFVIENETYVKEHLIHLKELKDNTTYYFKVTCRDEYGLKTSSEGEFVTLEKEIIPEPTEPEPTLPEPIEPEPEEPTEPEEPVEPGEPEVEEPEEPEEPAKPEEPTEPEEPEEPEDLLPPEEPSGWSLLDSIVVGLLVLVLGVVFWQWKRWMQKNA